MIAIRRDTAAAQVTEGKNAPLQVDAIGNLRVTLADAGTQTALVPPTAAAIAAAMLNPDTVTFNAPVAVNVAGGSYANLGYTAAELTRLHELSVKSSVADTIILYSADDAAGTGKAEVCRWGVAATGGPFYPHRAEAARCFKTAAVGKYLLLFAATAALTGFAVTSHKAT